jgi:hypothetical protein
MKWLNAKAGELELFENTIATLVDVTSILFAYQIGLHNFGWEVGILYSLLDAFVVVWMRRPISRFVRSINPYRIRAKEAGEKKRGSGQEGNGPWPSGLGQLEESEDEGFGSLASP